MNALDDRNSNHPQSGDRIPDLNVIANCCANRQVGKLLPNAFYIHICAVSHLDPLLQEYEQRARSVAPKLAKHTIIKFSTDKPKISYLFYPDFDTDPHPALQASIQVDLQTLEVGYRDYSSADNPPILHRKETFVSQNYPLYESFASLTRAQETIGLLGNPSGIGNRQGWEDRLAQYRVSVEGHELVKLGDFLPRIERHKAAIVRHDLSRPVRLALEAGLFVPDTNFFDYGCGYGGDINRIADLGYVSNGWDPYYSPDTPRIAADIVNIGYVINVIEDQNERREALIKAWELTQKVLVVSAQVLISDSRRGVMAYGDGIITSRNTFQKYYEQEELKNYIDQVLLVHCIPAGLGVYFVFRAETTAETFRASRFRSRTTTPRVRVPLKQFADYEQLLTPLMNFVTERGRLPQNGELPQEAEIKAEFGSLRRAFQVILQVTEPSEWDEISDRRRVDLLVYLALTQFGDRPKLSQFTPTVQADFKGLFGSYKQAGLLADTMLFSLSNQEAIAQACHHSVIGKKLPNSLQVHISAISALAPILRLYEGCASRTIGRLEQANVIKFHAKKPKISYFYYPDFDLTPHPTLQMSMQIDLRDLQVIYREYEPDEDPPILHYKSALVTPDYPEYESLVKLTFQEEDWGLLDDWRSISHLSGWLKCLEEHCTMLKGYKLSRCKDADPYKLKVLRSAVQSRQQKRYRTKGD
ncbi:DNA phosphorothioation-associated putative methyltransferase [Merismopedia glauca]|uniref:DNA phosphorothioation-associated methyltransferase n=1 Tax=Merismopedia glauca CCAP 1448/3 TaxID=1296344 RepID=A0A2T1BZS5_9CYAN|nr:DNA phosphorothioation-associated putative methyltransferase [Merismopedia glauca]PSB01492.1 DNA phosphorothioation-associated methyltransferase [Merismopedia glauca CCAP 1448/3]